MKNQTKQKQKQLIKKLSVSNNVYQKILAKKIKMMQKSKKNITINEVLDKIL